MTAAPCSGWCSGPPPGSPQSDLARLKEVADEFAFLLDDVGHLYERAKLLQEELAAWLAEQMGRRLFVLSLLSAILLPVTLITSIFGMNVAGLPGLESESSFWWVMLLIVGTGSSRSRCCAGAACFSASAWGGPSVIVGIA